MKCTKCNGTGQIPTGEEMAALRKEKGLTAKYVAKEMGISAGYLSDLELGKREWNFDLATRYRAAMEILG